MNHVDYKIGNRTITVRQSDRSCPSSGRTDWYLLEGKRMLTLADPWSTDDGPPTEQQVRAYLHPRRQRLQAYMAACRIMAGPDYDYEDVYEELFPERATAEADEEPPRWLSISRDETYSFFDLSRTFNGAARNLASRVGDDTGGVPVGIIDLETGREVDIATHTLVYEWDVDATWATSDHTARAVDRARRVLAAAMNELESAVLARVSVLIKREYPTATRLLYDGRENEDGLVHMHLQAILDVEGNVLDSKGKSSDAWEELIYEEVEPLLWEVSERDQSYYGEGRTLELKGTP